MCCENLLGEFRLKHHQGTHSLPPAEPTWNHQNRERRLEQCLLGSISGATPSLRKPMETMQIPDRNLKNLIGIAIAPHWSTDYQLWVTLTDF